MPQTSAEPRRRSRSTGLIVAIAAFVVALFAVTAFLLAQDGDEDATGPDTAATAAGATPAPSGSASLTPEQEEAKAQAIALMRAEPRRTEGDPYAKGAVDAPVVLVEFADFRCPYCAKYAQETQPLLEKYVADGTLRIEWRDLPIFGEESLPVHLAARAAGRQDMFWEYHDAVFAQTPLEGHRSWSDAELRAVAEEIGVPDVAQWDTDRADPEIAAEVEADREHATSDLGITATPAFILGDVFVPGAYPLSTFVQQIEAQAAAAEDH